LNNNGLTIPYLFFYNHEKNLLSKNKFVSITSYQSDSTILDIYLNIEENFIKNYFYIDLSNELQSNLNINKDILCDRLILFYLCKGMMISDIESDIFIRNADKYLMNFYNFIYFYDKLNNSKNLNNDDFNPNNIFNQCNKYK
jgi:hypothetical protein